MILFVFEGAEREPKIFKTLVCIILRIKEFLDIKKCGGLKMIL